MVLCFLPIPMILLSFSDTFSTSQGYDEKEHWVLIGCVLAMWVVHVMQIWFNPDIQSIETVEEEDDHNE